MLILFKITALKIYESIKLNKESRFIFLFLASGIQSFMVHKVSI